MSLSVVSITLNIRNNRTYPQRINVLGSPVNPLDTANALTEYRWDVTAYAPSPSDTLTLEYKPVGASVFSIFTYELSNANSEALVSALNTLGIGYFNYYTELGQNYLSTNNDNYVFNTLTINNNLPPTPTTSTTTTTTTAAPTTSTTTTTTTAAPTTTSTTTTTTTAAPTTTSTTTTTTTAAPELFALAYSVVGGDAACGTYPTTNNYYASAGSILQNGTILYTDSALTTPAPVGYYSNGVNWWYISGAGLAGELSSETACTSPTTTTTSTTSTTTTAAPTTTSTTTTTTTVGSVENFRSVTPQLNIGNACAQTTPTSIYTSLSESTMANGITFYSDAALTTPFAGNSQWFKIFWKGAVGFDDVYGVQIDANGVVLSFAFCSAITTTSTTTTTTTVAFETFSLAYSTIDGATACSDYPTLNTTNYYATSGSLLQTGTIIYTDTALTTPAPNGFYSNGVNYWNTSAGAGNLQNQTSCNPTTTTTSTTTTTTTAGSVENFRSVTPQIDLNNACAQSTPTSIYTSLSESTMANGITFYSDAALTTPFNGNSQWFKIFWKGAVGFDDIYGVQIDSSGVVLNFSFCPSTTTTTTTSTTSTTTTAPPTTTTSTTSTTTTLFTNLVFDATTGIGGYTIGGIDVNNVVPTLTGGTDVPFNTDTHSYNTDQVGTNETLNIFVSVFSVNGCITVTDSASNVFQQNIGSTGTYSFAGLVIDNITAVQVVCADNVC